MARQPGIMTAGERWMAAAVPPALAWPCHYPTRTAPFPRSLSAGWKLPPSCSQCQKHLPDSLLLSLCPHAVPLPGDCRLAPGKGKAPAQKAKSLQFWQRSSELTFRLAYLNNHTSGATPGCQGRCRNASHLRAPWHQSQSSPKGGRSGAPLGVQGVETR